MAGPRSQETKIGMGNFGNRILFARHGSHDVLVRIARLDDLQFFGNFLSPVHVAFGELAVLREQLFHSVERRAQDFRLCAWEFFLREFERARLVLVKVLQPLGQAVEQRLRLLRGCEFLAARERRRRKGIKRCADIDLGRWFKESYRVATDETPDEENGNPGPAGQER